METNLDAFEHWLLSIQSNPYALNNESVRAAWDAATERAIRIVLEAGYKSTGVPAYEFIADRIKREAK